MISRHPEIRSTLRVAVLGATLVLGSCGGHDKSQDISFDAGGGDTLTSNAATGQVSMHSADGMSATASPDGSGAIALPEGVDVYPGATVTSHMAMDISPGRKSYVVAAATPDSITKVLNHYRDLARAQGFTISKDEANADSWSLMVDKAAQDTGFTLLVKPDSPNTDFEIAAHGPAK